MRYWDSSAIAPLIVVENRTAQCEELLRKDSQIVTWWLSGVECASALNRLRREGIMDESELRTALVDLDTFCKSFVEVLPVAAIRTTATRLLRVHSLKAADSVQLAAAILAAGEERDALEFISFDDRLIAAADKEGFRCVAD